MRYLISILLLFLAAFPQMVRNIAFVLVSMISAHASAQFFEYSGNCSLGDGTNSNSLGCGGPQGVQTTVPGTFSGAGSSNFPGMSFYGPSSGNGSWSLTFEWGKIRVTGEGSVHIDALPDGYIATNDGGGGGSVYNIDLLTAFNPLLPVGAPVTIKYSIRVIGSGSKSTSGGATASYGWGTNWSFSGGGSVNERGSFNSNLPITLADSFVVPNGELLVIDWLFGASGGTSAYLDTANSPGPQGPADGSASADFTGRLYFGSDDLDVIFTALSGHNYVAPVPEPSIYAMLLAGLGLLGLVARRGKVLSIPASTKTPARQAT